ncbi:hypothetical protein JR316_0006567 [Psilocybe cubensis]|uniref:Uncharacterized protein n=1 Tax=Psilocybe cubensis TaxID=181762 RepID=A0ACB8H308_PSICU|nr:hypothetical protein JR316_0006567 [Psilocybe cubensis]KAH9482037.1 hypothetical protein JR316_0006567 [Psilocybe cubensis]
MQSPIIDSDTRSGASTPTGHPPSSISTDMYPQPRMVKRRRDHETESQSENVSNDGDAGSNEVQPYNVQPYNTRSKVRVVAPSYGDYLQIQVLADKNMRLKQELLRIQIDQIKGSKGLHSDDEISLTGDEETFYDAKMDSSSEDLQHQFEKLAETKEHPRRERQDAVKSLQAAQTTYEEELAQLKLKIHELSERNEELEREIQETEKLENVNDDLETEMYVKGVYVLGEAPRPSNVHVLERNLQEKSAQVNSTEDELKRLRSQVDEMEKANLLLGEEKKTSIDIMESKIAELNSNIHEFAKTTELLQMKEAVISNQEAELAELKAQINDLMKINQLLEEEKVAYVKSMEIELTKVRSQLESLQKDNDSLQLANEGILMQQVSYEDKLQLVLDSHNDEVHSLVENHRQVVSGFDAERILLQRELDLANETIKSFEFKENTDSRVPQVAGAEHLDNSNDNHTSSLLSARDAELNDLRCLLEAAERKQLADIEEVGSMKSSYVSRIEDLQTQLESEQNRNTELDKNASSLQQSNIRLLAIISGKEEELLELKGLYDEEKKVRQMELSAYRTKVEELASQLAEKDNDIVSARVAHEQEIQRLSFEHREKVAKLEDDCNKLAEDLRASRHRYQQDMIQQQRRFDAERSVFMKSNETVRELKGKLEEKNRTLQSGIRELEEEVRTLRRTNEQEKLQSIEVYANQVNSLTHQHKLEASKYQEDIRTMRTDLENLRETVAEKDESITSLNRARAALELQLADQSAQIASLASKVQIGDVNELTVLRKECDRLWKLIEEKDDDLEKEEAMALRVEMERMKAEAPLAANKANQTMTDMTTGTVQPGTSRGKQRQISPSMLSSAFPSRNVRFGSVEEVEDHVSQYASSSRVGGQGTSNYMTPSSSSSKSAKIDTSHFGRDRTPPVPPPRTYGKGRGAASSRSSRRAASVDRAEPATPSHSRLDDIDEDYSDDIPPEVSRPQTSSSDPDVAQALLAVAAKIGQMSENLTALPTLLSTRLGLSGGTSD